MTEPGLMATPGDAKDGRRTWHYESPSAPAGAEASAAKTGSLDVLLFYKYVVLDAEATAAWQRELCTSLGLSGRVLVGPEGINGSLAGSPEATAKYIATMDAHESFGNIDWKHSDSRDEPFPDLHIKIVKEIISTGGVIPNDFSNAGKHLPPAEFHTKLVEATPEDSVILDVRNYKEYSVGHFDGAIRSEMRVFSEFPRFIDHNIDTFKGKKVMMYCTGGIRCEKASAYLKSKGVDEVYQLQGGIHRYLEAYPDGGQFKGKNFVFDKRIMLPPPAAQADGEAKVEPEIVGKCEYCDAPFDGLDGGRVCTVCRDLVLCCPACDAKVREYHCELHMHLKDIYFTFLEPFSADELVAQKKSLLVIHDTLLGRRNKNRRHTLMRQVKKIDARLQELLVAGEGAPAGDVANASGAGAGAGAGAGIASDSAPQSCRTCGNPECSGRCWGFWKEEQPAGGAVASAVH